MQWVDPLFLDLELKNELMGQEESTLEGNPTF